MIETIAEVLDEMGFYIGNPDGEYSEKGYEKVIDELYDAIMDEGLRSMESYIKSYIQKNYPFNI